MRRHRVKVWRVSLGGSRKIAGAKSARLEVFMSPSRWRQRVCIPVLLMALGIGLCVPSVGVAADAGIPVDVAAAWQPLRPSASDPTYARKELSAALRNHAKKRYKKACFALEKVRAKLMKRGAAIFYKPVRKGADLAAIEAFMKRYVRGKTPLLQVAHEVFVPSAPFRRLAVDACMRSGRPLTSRGFLDHAATSSADRQLRTAAAIVRLASGEAPASVSWLVGRKGGGARAWLVRALGVPRSVAKKHLATARSKAASWDRLDVEKVAAWIEKQSGLKK